MTENVTNMLQPPKFGSALMALLESAPADLISHRVLDLVWEAALPSVNSARPIVAPPIRHDFKPEVVMPDPFHVQKLVKGRIADPKAQQLAAPCPIVDGTLHIQS